MPLRRIRPARRAAAAVELLLTVPIFFVLLVGIWEVGRLVELQQLVNNAAREGARQASTGQYTAADIKATVLTYLQNAGLSTTDSSGTTNVTVTAVDLTTGGDPKGAAQMDHVRVTVAFPMDNARYLASGGWTTKDYGVVGFGTFVPAGTLLNASADWFVMSDVPIVVPTSIPSAPLP
jgi:Flp pilus assembly protein TadG